MRAATREKNSGKGGFLQKIEPITVARTLTEADSGKVFMLSSADGAYSITLPTAATGVDGCHYKFIVEEETPTGAITIAAGSAIVSMVMKDAGGNASNSTIGTQVSNVIVGTSAQKGDYINIMFTGGEYVAECMSGIDDAVTTS
jgi:hypothetical protein|tara:strand:- start:1101 stop:1532 length:432 start_codon:yes stop_codon:yes gene_type:complete